MLYGTSAALTAVMEAPNANQELKRRFCFLIRMAMRGYLLHLHTDVSLSFLSSLLLSNVNKRSCNRVIATGQKYLLGGLRVFLGEGFFCTCLRSGVEIPKSWDSSLFSSEVC